MRLFVYITGQLISYLARLLTAPEKLYHLPPCPPGQDRNTSTCAVGHLHCTKLSRLCFVAGCYFVELLSLHSTGLGTGYEVREDKRTREESKRQNQGLITRAQQRHVSVSSFLPPLYFLPPPRNHIKVYGSNGGGYLRTVTHYCIA
jgi:hypothetical protein